MIKINFTKSQGDLVFVDSIVLPIDHSFTDEQIEQIKTDRFNNWLEAISEKDLPDESDEG